jgi:hypothetical protein
MHHDKSLFLNYHPLKYRLYVGGIGSGFKAVGVRDIEIRDPNGKNLMLNHVLHVPKLKCGLMLLNTLTMVGLNFTITKDRCTVSDGDFRIHIPIRNGLCPWSEEGALIDRGVNALFTGITPKEISLTDWYEQLAHVSKNTLLKLGEFSIADFHIDPAERTDEDHHTPCGSCVLGKHAHTPFLPHTTSPQKYSADLVISKKFPRLP